jgi:hypothetical protein
MMTPMTGDPDAVVGSPSTGCLRSRMPYHRDRILLEAETT